MSRDRVWDDECESQVDAESESQGESFGLLTKKIMDRSRINEYCQFCLKLQTEDRETLQLTNEMKTNFQLLTSKPVNS